MPKLIAHRAAHDVVAYLNEQIITAADYVNDCHALAESLPDTRFLLNFCKSRYFFAVGMGAAALRQQTMLLPPTQNQEIISQLQHTYSAPYVLYDDKALAVAELPGCKLDHTQLPSQLKKSSPPARFDFQIPEIPADHIMAYVFTSGSTGKPEPHAKTWGNLCRNAQAQLHRIMEDSGFDKAFSIVATVPPQHMYGFESSVLVALQGGQTFSAAHPFYPQDICKALEYLPHPRILVSTPFHLKMLMESNLALPHVDLIISATAPITTQFASSIEEKFETAVQEIYGCTETGQIATRLPTHQPVWRTYGQVEIVPSASIHEEENSPNAIAQGDYIATPTVLNDVIDIIDKHQFNLSGRKTDVINIAGKRSSLSYLNHQLNTIKGVQDGVFFMPQDAGISDNDTTETRLVAFVVAAQNISKSDILQALRKRIDAVFMPRPLYIVDALPRNSTGKLPHQQLIDFAQRVHATQGET